MAEEPSPTPAQINELLDAGELERAKALLATAPNDDSFAVVRVKLALYEGSMEPGMAMQVLIQLMRRDAEWPGAKVLYQEASGLAYTNRKSSVSHSHPPPPSEKH
jgi:hypothetical protein